MKWQNSVLTKPNVYFSVNVNDDAKYRQMPSYNLLLFLFDIIMNVGNKRYSM